MYSNNQDLINFQFLSRSVNITFKNSNLHPKGLISLKVK